MRTQTSTTESVTRWMHQLSPRLQDQMQFLIAIDALKSVHRASRIADNTRQENSAEHSWHLTLFARILSEHANEPVDVDRVVLMLMVHDIVEVDAGDVPLHSVQTADARREQQAREQAAAERLFGLLPTDQAELLRSCWQEFEAGISAEARFAKAVDRLQPILLNALTQGGTWLDYQVRVDQMLTRCARIADGSQTLWSMANAIFSEAAEQGWLKTAPPADSP